MTTEQVWLGATGALAVGLALVALALALRARQRSTRAEALAASLAERLAALEAPAPEAPTPEALRRPVDDAEAYVITHLDATHAAEPPVAPLAGPVAGTIDGRLFVDLVARESVVKAAAWTHGLRRAVSPESRNRIRFGVRQETRRVGRERRAEAKQALREFRARERAAGSDAPAAPGRVSEDVA